MGLKILGVPRLPFGGSLGTGKRGTVPKIWGAVPIFFSACKWGFGPTIGGSQYNFRDAGFSLFEGRDSGF